MVEARPNRLRRKSSRSSSGDMASADIIIAANFSSLLTPPLAIEAAG